MFLEHKLLLSKYSLYTLKKLCSSLRFLEFFKGKVNHLSYVGDARIGSNANVGAGTITANYDGVRKSHTTVGAGASIGSNSVLVAPVNIGDGAVVGAGSVVRDDIPKDALFVKGNRQDSRVIKKWASDRREREEKEDT